MLVRPQALKEMYDELTFSFRRDTVNSVGTIRAIKLPYTANNDMIRVGRHALALDERRVRFKANMLGYGPVYGRERRLDTDTLEVRIRHYTT